MLSEHEQRVLAELEGSLVQAGGPGSREPATARWFRDMSPPGWTGFGLIAAFSAFLLMSGAAVGGAALLLAVGLVWLSWSYWPLLAQQSDLLGEGFDGRLGGSWTGTGEALRGGGEAR